MTQFQLNGKTVSFEGDQETPLLWALRDHLKLTGTKFGCGIGICGACTVHIDGRAKKACVTKISNIAGKQVTTIEGLASEDGRLHPVQQSWLEEDVAQCGYCQSGQIMAAVDLLERKPQPSDDDIADGISNICRCGTYKRIRSAIHRAARSMAEEA